MKFSEIKYKVILHLRSNSRYQNRLHARRLVSRIAEKP